MWSHTTALEYGKIQVSMKKACEPSIRTIPCPPKCFARRRILVAGMGTSPAVLTNAVWALAHQRVPVVPDEIVVFITKNGKTLLKKELFDGGVWADMLKCLASEGVDVEGKLMFGETSIRSIPDAKGNEIDDLRTGEDNLRAADFMLAQLRQCKFKRYMI